ncbi:SnoaL-like domain-containing protein [Persicobacter psychrovividus]|uniref:SnoaL-like domain-containing protein n=1 Tax=Persicobacter psychrovividus TaxID=387638 RepID=A0ABM7VJH6_9BACT|nr:hypothetical protein PEPS_33860 [Persicobacter psychrovividus]
MSNLAKAKELYDMMAQGKMMDAFEKHYHQDCKIIEATGEVRQGKDAQRKALEDWQNNFVKEMHDGGVDAITADEQQNITMVESWTDLTNQQGERLKMAEVAVQKWQDGQIIQERFYYNS